MPCETRAAHSVVEACLYLTVSPCATCRSGAVEVGSPSPTDEAGCVRFRVTCRNCATTEDCVFRVSDSQVRGDPLSSAAPISTSREPSALIDAVQWTTLAQIQLEAAESTPAPPEQRWRRIRAAQCLDEALKFYDHDNELPPAEALFVEASRIAVRDHPQRFARTRLLEQRAALPVDGAFGKVLAGNAAARRKPWWRFW